MRVFFILIVCVQLCACSAARSFLLFSGEDSQSGERIQQDAGVSPNPCHAKAGEAGGNPGGQPDDSPAVKMLKTIGGVVWGVVLVGLSVAAKVPFGAL